MNKWVTQTGTWFQRKMHTAKLASCLTLAQIFTEVKLCKNSKGKAGVGFTAKYTYCQVRE